MNTLSGLMTMNKKIIGIFIILLLVPLFFTESAVAQISKEELGAVEDGSAVSQISEEKLDAFEEVQQYYRAIHIMVMLLIGFGFLMVFVRGYGRSALTATFLLVSVAIPVYIMLNGLGIFQGAASDIEGLILAEFAAASLLICAGAVLGRLKMPQYMLMGLLFIPFYMINEWILLSGGLGMIPAGTFADTGGSIVIHAFGALFGLGVVISMKTKEAFNTPIETDATSERFSMLGTMALWVFWPSFCAALVAPADIPHTVVAVVLALCGSTIATYIASATLRKKISVTDIANASLAGGVAIGATCDFASFPVAIFIGILAGALSTYGFAVVQEKLQDRVKAIDTCGVMNLHGYPGLMGGIAAMFVVSGINVGSQTIGIIVTIVGALATGFVTGKILSVIGRIAQPYQDSSTFIEAEE